MPVTVQNTQSVLLTENEQQALAYFLEELDSRQSRAETVRDGNTVFPMEIRNLLSEILAAIETGETISLSAMPTEVTTTAAASMLNVSRPTVMKLIRSGRLTARKVGSHHRLNTQEVCALREEMKQTEREAIFELINFEESLT